VHLSSVYAGKTLQWVAKIVRDEGIIDNLSRMNYLVAEISDPYLLKGKPASQTHSTPLRFGSYVNAEILGEKLESETSIPSHLVENNRIAILDKDSTLRYAEIDIYRKEGGSVIASSGLSNGDRIIISALDSPIAGMKLALHSDSQDQQLSQNESSNTATSTGSI